MTDIEIPYEKDRHGWYRFFEILPGSLSWALLFTPLILSFISATAAVLFVLIYLLVFFVRSVAYSVRALQGYFAMKKMLQLDWSGFLEDIELGKPSDKPIRRPGWHIASLKRRAELGLTVKPSELYHAVIIATVNESREVLEPTIQSVLASDYDPKKLILVFAYEARAGKESEERVRELLQVYGEQFYHAMAVKHPAGLPGEIVGKGSNITCAGRELKKYLEQTDLDPAKVIVTTLDADNRPDKHYLAGVSYLFCVVPDPIRASYQPLPMFTNNIWDASTLMRVIATSNTLFYIVGTQRVHRARNFSAHAQSMRALIDMDFWSVRTIVEDGHHFWRSYFFYDGNYRVYPLSIPIYQDAVLADGYLRTMKAQFMQLRRWTYGASDIAYVAQKGLRRKNHIPKHDVISKLLVLLEGHVTWATGTILVFFAAFIPPLFHPHSTAALDLPVVVSRMQRIGLFGLLASVYVCLVTLPPRPARYRRHRSILMVAQWVLAPVTSICFAALAAYNSQTRLMFRRYPSKFDVTEKAIISESGKRTTTTADPDNP